MTQSIKKIVGLMGVIAILGALILGTTATTVFAQDQTTIICKQQTTATGETRYTECLDENGNPVNVDGSPVQPTEPDPGVLATCPTAFEASRLIAGPEAALVREAGAPSEYCLFEWQQAFDPDKQVICPDGWACELDTVGPDGFYYIGGNGTYQIDRGSFRLINAYPATDPVHEGCLVLANSQGFVEDTSPESGFQMLAGNFTCDPVLEPVAPPDGTVTNVCPDNAADVATWVGGLAREWSRLNDGQWKRQSASRRAHLQAPWGTLDVWDGHEAFMGVTDARKAYEATWNCSIS